MIVELEKSKLTKKIFKISSHFRKISGWKFFFKFFWLAQKMRLEILGGPLGVKFRIQGHLGVGKGEKPPFEQHCPKADATIKILSTLRFKTVPQSLVKFWPIQILFSLLDFFFVCWTFLCSFSQKHIERMSKHWADWKSPTVARIGWKVF